MECYRELSLIMYFLISVLCECGEDMNNSIVVLCMYALFLLWLSLLDIEHGIKASIRLFEDWREFSSYCRVFSGLIKSQ
jgi:hypothetical protein